MTRPNRYEIKEADRQAIVLALAKLSLTRPGWVDMLRELADGTFRAGGMFEEFVSHGPDTPTGTPLGIFERVELLEPLHSDDPENEAAGRALAAEGDLVLSEIRRNRAELRDALETALEVLTEDDARDTDAEGGEFDQHGKPREEGTPA